MEYKTQLYQVHAVKHVLENPYCGVLVETGLGNTSVSLNALDILMFEDMAISKILVIAPKRVAENVWRQEAEKWDHLKHLTFSVVSGKTATGRTEALKRKADIYVINRENVPWLVNHYQSKFPFDTVVLDELSSFKNSDTARFKSLKGVRPSIKRVIALTGTPIPNGLVDLWSELYLLDRGQRLGTTKSGYTDQLFIQNRNGYGYKPRDGASEEIYKRIEDICISMKAKDYLDLPGRIEHTVNVDLPEDVQEAYNDFEKDKVIEIMQDKEISAINAGVLFGKLLQFASGAIYDEEGKYHVVHDLKLDALEDIIESAQGQPVLVFYWFKHDLERIKKRFPKVRTLDSQADIKQWDKGGIEMAAVHPASAGHGLNLQYGGNIMVWFSNTTSSELKLQGEGRIDRQGQTRRVVIYKLVARKTMDERAIQIADGKVSVQDALMDAVKALIAQYQRGT